MSAHDLALGLALAVTSFWAGVWVQRGYQSDALDHATAALARCGRVADKADAVGAGLHDGSNDAYGEVFHTSAYLIRCAITGTPDPRMDDEWSQV